MISNLNKSEFKEKLEKLTKIGNPEMKGIPFLYLSMFSQNPCRFYGQYDKSSFNLTDNTSPLYSMYSFEFDFQAPYIIEGTYKSINKSSTKVSYKFRPILTSYLFYRYFPIFILIFINMESIIDWNLEVLKENLVFDIFILFLIPFWIFMERRSKRKFEKDFKRIFEIENE